MIFTSGLWKCDVCGRTQNDHSISVLTTDISAEHGFPVGTIKQNVKYCNFKNECIEAAKSFRFFKQKVDMNTVILNEGETVINPFKTFKKGQEVRKTKGAEWQGYVVGFYTTDLTPEGYCVESRDHKGSVQIYPVSALEAVKKDDTSE